MGNRGLLPWKIRKQDKRRVLTDLFLNDCSTLVILVLASASTRKPGTVFGFIAFAATVFFSWLSRPRELVAVFAWHSAQCPSWVVKFLGRASGGLFSSRGLACDLFRLVVSGAWRGRVGFGIWKGFWGGCLWVWMHDVGILDGAVNWTFGEEVR